mmetsp:Transcript_6004/g.7566  ORF Transcript_6004/g.7566 Transcript_6004/m.7566 type:complete len:281 (-) Transcript_6004:33-875(-)
MLAGLSVSCQLYARSAKMAVHSFMPANFLLRPRPDSAIKFNTAIRSDGNRYNRYFHTLGNSRKHRRTSLFDSKFSQLGLIKSYLGCICKRDFSACSAQSANRQHVKNQATAIYFLSIVVVGVGVAYAAVPLYKMFCQATGFGGTTRQATMDQAKKMVPVKGAHPITVRFAASTSDTLQWKFQPQQREVKVVPGETALAFYTAYNKTDEPIVGVATYNITPLKAGVYFNKIQCFCFDQQRLRPKEEVDMPVFFYIDPEFAIDPQMANVRDIVLSYTFFKAK